MKSVGILTFHSAYNYGAFLQAYCLCQRLRREGIHAEIIDFTMPVAMTAYDPDQWRLISKIRHFSDLRFQRMVKNAFLRGKEKIKDALSENSLLSNSIEEFKEFVEGRYDAIIVGSDEVWKIEGRRGFPSPYWLEGDLNCIKLSYAAASGTKIEELSNEKRERVRQLLSEFEIISVRDAVTYNFVSHCIQDQNIVQNCDPSFLYKIPINEKSDLLHKKAGIDSTKKTIILMVDNKKIANEIIGAIDNKRYNLVSLRHYNRKCINLADLDPFEWAEVLANADLVISSFFHAVCYSIIYNTPFIAIGTSSKEGKLKGLLKDTELYRHYFDLSTTSISPDTLMVEKQFDRGSYKQFVEAQQEGFPEYLSRLMNVLEMRKECQEKKTC